MKFREYVAARTPLREADLLGVPSQSSASSERSAGSKPSSGINPKASAVGDLKAYEPGPAPGELNDQMRKAMVLTAQLQKALAALPHPWNKTFHSHRRFLQALAHILQEKS